jgi:high-affinity nickel-transport protein
VTLLVLGVYVFYALVRHGRDFRMRSRWMLVFSGVRRGSRWVRRRVRAGGDAAGAETSGLPPDDEVEHEHEHVAGTPHHVAVETPAQTAAALKTRGQHGHRHRHPGSSGDDAFMSYGKGTSYVVGLIHGVGAETPTQVLVFLAAASAGGPAVGVFLLAVFLAGLFLSNTGIAIASTYGFLAAGKSFVVYASVAILTGAFSLVLGLLFVFGKGNVVPAIFGG